MSPWSHGRIGPANSRSWPSPRGPHADQDGWRPEHASLPPDSRKHGVSPVTRRETLNSSGVVFASRLHVHVQWRTLVEHPLSRGWAEGKRRPDLRVRPAGHAGTGMRARRTGRRSEAFNSGQSGPGPKPIWSRPHLVCTGGPGSGRGGRAACPASEDGTFPRRTRDCCHAAHLRTDCATPPN